MNRGRKLTTTEKSPRAFALMRQFRSDGHEGRDLLSAPRTLLVGLPSSKAMAVIFGNVVARSCMVRPAVEPASALSRPWMPSICSASIRWLLRRLPNRGSAALVTAKSMHESYRIVVREPRLLAVFRSCFRGILALRFALLPVKGEQGTPPMLLSLSSIRGR